MYDFDGITIEALMLLEQNKFNNSKPFYEENKEKIKELAIKPMRQIAQTVGSQMLRYDDLICAVPSKMVSRVRRDTRFTKDKTLYRDHLWVSFQRPKKDFPEAPGFWFGIEQNSYNYGMGFYSTTPALLEYYRKELLKRPNDFAKALKQAKKSNIRIFGEKYKNPKPGNPPEAIAEYYNMKSFYFMFSSPDLSRLQSDAVIDEMLSAFKDLVPMYRFLMDITEKKMRGE